MFLTATTVTTTFKVHHLKLSILAPEPGKDIVEFTEPFVTPADAVANVIIIFVVPEVRKVSLKVEMLKAVGSL